MRMFVLITLLAVLTSPSAAQPARGKVVRLAPVGTDVLVERPLSIYLPPGYAAASESYPVIYAMDGQNLFEPGHSFGGVEWGLDEWMDRLIADGRIRPAIIVGIWNTSARGREYAPQAVFTELPLEGQARAMDAWGGVVLSDAYLRFVVEDIKPLIDARFRTQPQAETTAIMGSSMGGLISLYALAEYPDTFGAAAGLSTHWPIYADQRFADPDVADGWRGEALLAWSAYLADARLDPAHQRLWLDHGTINLDALYPPYQAEIGIMLAARGFVEGGRYRSRRYEGADHNEAAWHERLADPLVFLLGGEGEALDAAE